MRKLLILALFCIAFIPAKAQYQVSSSLEELETICLNLSNAVQNFSDQNITDANESFRQFRAKNSIGAMPVKRVKSSSKKEIEGDYIVFLPEFFDKLVADDRAYELAQSLRKHFEIDRSAKKVLRGKGRQYKYFQKDLIIGPGEIISFELEDRPSPFEIIAIASPGGAFNLSVDDISNNKHYNEEYKETSGDIKRQRSVHGSKKGHYRITIENMVEGSYSIVLFCN